MALGAESGAGGLRDSPGVPANSDLRGRSSGPEGVYAHKEHAIPRSAHALSDTGAPLSGSTSALCSDIWMTEPQGLRVKRSWMLGGQWVGSRVRMGVGEIKPIVLLGKLRTAGKSPMHEEHGLFFSCMIQIMIALLLTCKSVSSYKGEVKR